MFIRMITAIGLLIFNIEVGWSANIEMTGYGPGQTAMGVKIEGEIQPGDASKFLSLYEYFGPVATANLFLWSRGGDVGEAIRIGKLVRQLRIATYAPDRLNVLGLFGYHVGPIDNGNNFCASACVLIYAAGAYRTGDILILHRPYLTAEVAKSISDVEFEIKEKHALYIVRDYLNEMEFDQFYIDKILNTSSQDGYQPTKKDLKDHPLTIIPPSIEEIILSQCKSLTIEDKATLGTTFLQTKPKNSNAAKILAEKFETYSKCEQAKLSDLRLSAWRRINDVVISKKCRDKVGGGSNIDDCKDGAYREFTLQILKRGEEAKPGATPPRDFFLDSSLLEQISNE